MLNPQHINEIRAAIVWITRGVAANLIAIGCYLCLKRLLFAWGATSMRDMLTTWMEIGEQHSFYRGAAMIFIGAILGALSSRLSQWIITVPSDSCPRCGQSRSPGAAGPCTECGLPSVNG